MAAEPDTARVNEYLFRIRQLAQSQNSYVLHFDCAVGDLRAWLWPITNAGQRVTPEGLASYRASGFRRPCCLCAVPRLDGVSLGYIESAVNMGEDGEHLGQFVLTCARRKCKYQVLLDKAYVSVGLPLKRYTRLQKVMGTQSPLSRRSRARGHNLKATASGIRRSAPLAIEDSPSMKLLRLNSFISPGLPEEEFQALFTKCRGCRWIMTERAFRNHSCFPLGPAVEVIDLTVESDED